ncbi:MAG: YggS family pyridoxal phosphate-dependent enzyme [Cyclobacteriaceae bacterium]|nr:YggS family pyridoxal phosphate-dependent enzyme [Cyclobacteriaceae bacterium]MCH8516690.1 YggS family pyridoxal phosphate-dependent enzyme [Cyclobacteriaceae bacterium]
MNITNSLKTILEEIPSHVTLVAVSKTKPNEAIEEAYASGHLDFGENKVQELTQKAESLPKNIRWHMIGHLQRNKVKYIAPFVHLIHGVDTFKLLKEIEKQGRKEDRKINCLLQMHIAEEDSKFGLDEAELMELVHDEQFKSMEYVNVLGLMGMATFTENEEQIIREFKSLKSYFDRLKVDKELPTHCKMEILSMGMSGDYQLAIQEGSTMIRIGSNIFGARK